MEDHLAVELGATIYGSVPTVASHADGGKRSISTPGAGNYLTVAQAAASVHDLLGKDVLAYETIVQAHGTSTPQNRVTESDVLSRVARTFGIESWAVCAVKSQLGHSQGTRWRSISHQSGRLCIADYSRNPDDRHGCT